MDSLEAAPPRKNVVRRLYDWVLSWADSPHGTWALFALSFAESSFFPIPPDPLLIALALGKRRRSHWFALVCSAASVLGGILGYALGHWMWDSLSGFFFDHVPGFTPEKEQWFRSAYDDKGAVLVLLAAFTPIPYKVFTLLSGAVGMNFPLFVLMSVLGRSARFFFFAELIRRFGEPIRGFIDRYFDRLCLAFLLLLGLGFVAVKYLL